MQERDMSPAQQQSKGDGKHFRFLDLTAEIRNAIYEFSLVHTRKITIYGVTHIQITYMGPLRSWHWQSDCQSTLSPNLLATCKAIHREATSILYGLNQFEISQNSDLNIIFTTWPEHIGTSVEHLRSVTLPGATHQGFVKRTLVDLKGAICLESLIIDSSCSINFRTTKTMADALYPLISHLHKARKNTDKKAVLEMLDVQTTDAAATTEILKKKLKL